MKQTFCIAKSKCCLKDYEEFREFSANDRELVLSSSAGSLALKMTFGCSCVSATEQGVESRARPAIGNILISCDGVRFSAHQYPVNIRETQVFRFWCLLHINIISCLQEV